MRDSAERRNNSDIGERQSDATSDETVSDLSDQEKDRVDTTDRTDPSPDGRLDESDELKRADPM